MRSRLALVLAAVRRCRGCRANERVLLCRRRASVLLLLLLLAHLLRRCWGSAWARGDVGRRHSGDLLLLCVVLVLQLAIQLVRHHV
jgi:hypothetical protein